MTRRILFIMISLVLALSLLSCAEQNDGTGNSYPVSGGSAEPTPVVEGDAENELPTQTDPFSQAIKDAIAEQNRGKYLPGECYGVGYAIMETFEEEDVISVYALTEYVEYRFEDGVFINASGTNPKVLMRFRKIADGGYDLIFYTRLDLFSDLPEEEIEALLQPLTGSGKSYLYTEQDLQEVRKQADEDAAAYLKSIGRDAEIGVRQEHEGQRLVELVSNESLLDALFKDAEWSLYPYWTGTTERVEAGVRYIYQTDFDQERQEIVYTKWEYNTKAVLKSTVVDVQRGTIA